MALGYQDTSFAYQGSGQFAYQGGSVPVGPTVYYQGGDDAPRKTRRKRRDLFHDMERTIHALLHPPAPAHPIVAAVPVVPSESLRTKLDDLLALAGESHGLLQRAGRLRADLAALEAQRQAIRDRDEEEEFLIWMS